MIDCHFHIWDINKNYYKWLTSDLVELYHTFSIEDYQHIVKPFEVKTAIVIQAADDINETIFLLKIANTNPIIGGVIGWIDFKSENFLEDLQKITAYKHLKGLRPMLQDIEDINWINNPKFYKVFEELIKNDLIFEALVRQEHLKNIINIAKKYPNLKIVINHGAKPRIDNQLNTKNFTEWKELIKEVSSYANVTCKLSGLVTECTHDHSKKTILPYVKTIIESFTPKRVIWGSDWPVVKLKCDYEEWIYLSKDVLSYLDENEQEDIFKNNAKKIYKI